MFPNRYRRRLKHFTEVCCFEGLSLSAGPSQYRRFFRLLTGVTLFFSHGETTAAMDIQDDEAYHSGQYLQAEQLDAGDSEKLAASAKRSGPGPHTHLGTKREEGGQMSQVFGKEEAYKGLGMQEANVEPSPSRRKGTGKATTPQGVINADTPTTSLAKGLALFNIKPARSPHQQASVDSPLSDYSSGNFPSIPDAGYVSMPSMPSLDKDKNEPVSDTTPKSSTVAAAGSTGVATRITKGSESESMDIDVVGTPTEDRVQILPKPPPPPTVLPGSSPVTVTRQVMLPVTVTLVSTQPPQVPPYGLRIDGTSVMDLQKRVPVTTGAGEIMKEKPHRERLSPSPTKYRKSKSPSPSPASSSLGTSPIHVRSESPKSIPSVGENVEIITDSAMGVAMDDDIINSSRPEGATMKRMASSGAETMAEYYGRSSKKAARLNDMSNAAGEW